MAAADNPFARFREAIRELLLAVDPTFPLTEFQLIGRDKHDVIRRRINLDLVAARPDGEANGDAPHLNRIERTLLRAVAHLEADAPTGPEIAAAAHLPYEQPLRKVLSALRKRGLLGGETGDQGYPITPLGLAAVQEPH